MWAQLTFFDSPKWSIKFTTDITPNIAITRDTAIRGMIELSYICKSCQDNANVNDCAFTCGVISLDTNLGSRSAKRRITIMIPNTATNIPRIVILSVVGQAVVNSQAIRITNTKKKKMKVATPITPNNRLLGCCTNVSSSGSCVSDLMLAWGEIENWTKFWI